jgi:hypothetical protein
MVTRRLSMITFVDPALLVSPLWRQVITKSAGFNSNMNGNGVYDHQQLELVLIVIAGYDYRSSTIDIIPGTFGTTSYDLWWSQFSFMNRSFYLLLALSGIDFAENSKSSAIFIKVKDLLLLAVGPHNSKLFPTLLKFLNLLVFWISANLEKINFNKKSPL